MQQSPAAPRMLNILLAEDDPNDIKLLKVALAEDKVPAKFVLVQDGEEVIEYLTGRKTFFDREKFPFPDLVILDLNMPRMNGMEILKWLRHKPSYARLPVVMLSGSGLEQDVVNAYELGANSYFRKPSSVAALSSLLRTLAMYWQLTERPALKTAWA